jgi:hypothetical protein
MVFRWSFAFFTENSFLQFLVFQWGAENSFLSKSFEVLLDGTTSGIQIIERGKNCTSKIALGRDGAKWFCSSMVEICSTPVDQNYSRSFREAAVAFVIQKNWNGRGSFISVAAYGGGRNKDYMVILVGRDLWGCRGLYQILSELVAPEKLQDTSRPRPPAPPRPQSFKDTVIRRTVDAVIRGFNHVGYGK